MRRIALALALALVLVVVCAPAVASGSEPEPKMLGPYGKGADAYWLWKARGTPKSVVVFEHGLDESELNPWNHVPWIDRPCNGGRRSGCRSTG